MMIADAHVHVGYFNCRKSGKVEYYSPRRVIGVLNRCKVDEFVVSSTSAQAAGITAGGLMDEAREIKRVAGGRAHLFYWLTWELYCIDRTLGFLDSQLFEGVKFHELETPWVGRHRKDLEVVLGEIERRGLATVQFHSCPYGKSQPRVLLELAKEHPNLRFDFAHCRPIDEMAEVVAGCPNVWTDTAYMRMGDYLELGNYDWRGRLMFGTDIPVWQAHEDVGLTQRYRECVEAFRATGIDGERAFASYLGGER